ncbi:restriction endonuclease [Pantoea anthophila]|uniref:restriction endonuclease n=1 Tax=Pantoea anthophila TaxID=470931 RepID=UPI000614B2F7|nr:restriction endonuclease [Pantoea anthophila]KKB02724.1 hypothetical protein TN98_21030 [Pantoea anthophila]
MIDNPLPASWQDLQFGVQRIFRNLGLNAEVEVDLETPRGSVNVDVLATDIRSLDKITYIVECKNWGNNIPQSVVHSFTTVMHETGANVGFIISKHGLQQGAKRYTKNTNIIGMTYLEFQQRYFEAWWRRYFCPRIGGAADEPLQYVEPMNGKRDKEYAKLSPQAQEEFIQLERERGMLVMVMAMMDASSYSPSMRHLGDIPNNFEEFKEKVLTQIAPGIDYRCNTYRELLEIILEYLADTKARFDAIFGGAIFEPRESRNKITVLGPPLIGDVYHY